jgi:hypothetical protein
MTPQDIAMLTSWPSFFDEKNTTIKFLDVRYIFRYEDIELRRGGRDCHVWTARGVLARQIIAGADLRIVISAISADGLTPVIIVFRPGAATKLYRSR